MIDSSTFRLRLERLEQWLWGDGFHTLRLGAAPPADAALADRVLELSDLYTLERDRITGAVVRSGHLLARSLYYLCADAPKIHLVLDELLRRGAWTAPSRLHVADAGCGVGATSIGLLLSLPSGTAVTLRGTDGDGSCLEAWRATVRAAAAIADVQLDADAAVGDLAMSGDAAQAAAPSPRGGAEAHLTLCQAALNERLLDASPASTDEASESPDRHASGTAAENRHGAETVELIRRWCGLGTTIIIEPALRVTTRPLQRLRDDLLEGGGVRVLAPCPHQRGCPMLASRRDWCHEIRHWRPTPRVDAIQRITRRRDERLKYSFLALSAASTLTGAEEARRARVVSDPLRTKGKVERVVCMADGTLRKLRLLDRQRTAGNAALADAPRGALLTIDGLTERDRVEPQMRIDLVR